MLICLFLPGGTSIQEEDKQDGGELDETELAIKQAMQVVSFFVIIFYKNVFLFTLCSSPLEGKFRNCPEGGAAVQRRR
jgi:hypothetical protein